MIDNSKIKIRYPTLDELRIFFENHKSPHFRYFEKRNYESIKNHLYTRLYIYEDKIFGYGHIDNDENNQKKWLGIFIAEEFRGKKLSKCIMNDLIDNCNENIYLTVDLYNKNAFSLYTKIGFNVIEQNEKYYLMEYKK
jgi:RimJ/RimL family protein N-acetyltransferase